MQNSLSHKRRKYRAYILRLWCNGDDHSWRVALENIHSGEQKRFSSLKKLMVFLDKEAIGHDMQEEKE